MSHESQSRGGSDDGDRAQIPLARPALGDAEIAAAERALRSGRLVLGPENERFERALARRTGRAHAIAVSSGTAALELALWSLEIGPGDEVLLTAFGFAAAANAVARIGATPVPVDVDPRTWNTDSSALRSAISKRTRAIISIDQLGLMAESEPLTEVAREAGLPLIEDAACGLGGRDSAGTPGGGYGVLATLSFHPRKIITTGEGGAIVCDDEQLAGSLRRLRNHGQAENGRFVCPGTNARLGEAAAAVGCVQLDRIDAMVAERSRLAEGYRSRLAPLREDDRICWQVPTAGATHTYQTFAVVLPEGCERDDVRRCLAARGIEVGPATYAFHRLASFARPPARGGSDGAHACDDLAVADSLHERGLALPLFVGMSAAQLDRVADALREEVA